MDIILRSKTMILVESQCSTFMFIGFTLGILICKASEGDNIIILEVLSFKPCDLTPSEVTPQESEMYVIHTSTGISEVMKPNLHNINSLGVVQTYLTITLPYKTDIKLN